MAEYKWFLLNQAICNYAFDVVICVWQPVALFPYYCGFSSSGLLRPHSSLATRLSYAAFAFVAASKGCALTGAFIHRYVFALSVNQLLIDAYQSVTPYFQLLVWAFLASISTSVCWYSEAQFEPVRRNISSASPTMANVFERESNAFCIATKENDRPVLIFALLAFFINAVGFILLVHAIYLMLQRKGKVAHKTFRLQWMLLMSCGLQMLWAFVWLFLPFYYALLVAYFNVPYVNKSISILFTFATTHSIMDFLTVVYSIKPYRAYVYSFLCNLFNRALPSLRSTDSGFRHHLPRS